MRRPAAFSGVLFALAAVFVIGHEPASLEKAIRALMPSDALCAGGEGVTVRCEYPQRTPHEVAATHRQDGSTAIEVKPDRVEGYRAGIQEVNRLQGFSADDVTACIRGALEKRRSMQKIEHGLTIMNCWADADVLFVSAQTSKPF